MRVGGATDAGAAGQRLPRSVVLLGWVSFFADVSSEMVYPLIPLFVVGVLGALAAFGVGAVAAVLAVMLVPVLRPRRVGTR